MIVFRQNLPRERDPLARARPTNGLPLSQQAPIHGTCPKKESASSSGRQAPHHAPRASTPERISPSQSTPFKAKQRNTRLAIAPTASATSHAFKAACLLRANSEPPRNSCRIVTQHDGMKVWRKERKRRSSCVQGAFPYPSKNLLGLPRCKTVSLCMARVTAT